LIMMTTKKKKKKRGRKWKSAGVDTILDGAKDAHPRTAATKPRHKEHK
jgi:hypothetical protein